MAMHAQDDHLHARQPASVLEDALERELLGRLARIVGFAIALALTSGQPTALPSGSPTGEPSAELSTPRAKRS